MKKLSLFALLSFLPGVALASPLCGFAIPIDLSFLPRSLFVAGLGTEEPRVLRAILVSGKAEEKDATLYFVGRYETSAGGPYFGVIVGDRGIVVTPKADLPECRDAVDLAREQVEKERQLTVLEKQLDNEEQSLKRLKSDADIIGNIGKIVSAEENLGSIKEDTARLESIGVSLRAHLEAIKTMPVPRSLQRRESELIQQLNELSLVSREAEGGRTQRQHDTQRDLQAKLALIESTKGDHLDLLNRELARLRKEREALEASSRVRVAPPAGDVFDDEEPAEAPE